MEGCPAQRILPVMQIRFGREAGLLNDPHPGEPGQSVESRDTGFFCSLCKRYCSLSLHLIGRVPIWPHGRRHEVVPGGNPCVSGPSHILEEAESLRDACVADTKPISAPSARCCRYRGHLSHLDTLLGRITLIDADAVCPELPRPVCESEMPQGNGQVLRDLRNAVAADAKSLGGRVAAPRVGSSYPALPALGSSSTSWRSHCSSASSEFEGCRTMTRMVFNADRGWYQTQQQLPGCSMRPQREAHSPRLHVPS